MRVLRLLASNSSEVVHNWATQSEDCKTGQQVSQSSESENISDEEVKEDGEVQYQGEVDCSDQGSDAEYSENISCWDDSVVVSDGQCPYEEQQER